MKKSVIILLAITALCVVLTFLIVHKYTNGRLPATETNKINENIVYENAYIVSNEDNTINFVCGGKLFSTDGTMQENYTGVADISVVDGKIKKISSKPDVMTGKMLSYNEGQMNIEGTGQMPMVSKQIPVYDASGENVQEIAIDELVVGAEELSYVLDSGKICAIVRNNDPDLTYIRVLLKNGSDELWDDIAVEVSADPGGTQTLMINDEQTDIRKIESIKQYFEQSGSDTIKISPANGFFLFDGHTYVGVLECRQYDGGITAVNTINVEDYVRYVLPSEMPSTYDAQALMAQAVCARTFAYAQMHNGTYADYGANIDDSTAYQVYNSGGTYESTDKAVKDTAHQVITCGGELITCYYFSTSPGMTEDMEVWDSQTPQYIKKVRSEDDNSPYYRWKAALDASEYTDEKIGKLTAINVEKTSDSGYVLSVTLEGTEGKITYKTENDIRKALGRYLKSIELNDGSKRENLTMIPSACFTVEKSGDGQFILSGGGFGHGIGRSQCGAGKMAENGASYNDIIGYYYKDVTITDINDLAG